MRTTSLLTWRNPFVLLLIMVVVSTVGTIAWAITPLPLAVGVAIVGCWVVTLGMVALCLAAIVLEEKSRANRNQETEE